MALEIHPLTAARKTGRFPLFDDLTEALEKNGVVLAGGDIVAVSSKYAAIAQGRVIDLAGIRTYPHGSRTAARYRMSAQFAEVVCRESDAVHGGMGGFAMSSTTGGIMAPNAGIDRSNAGGGGTAVLYPDDPCGTAEYLRRTAFLRLACSIGIIMVDSRLMPARAGTTGVAIACAGIEPVTDMRARPDLDGIPLKVTVQATADGLAAAANHGMGEGAESRPYAVIRGSGARLTSRTVSAAESSVPHDQCIYVRSLRGGGSGYDQES